MLILRIAGLVLFVVVFNALALLLVVELPAPFDTVSALLLGLAFYGWSVRRGGNRRERLALLRLRPPRAAAGWVLLCCAATLLLAFGISAVITLVVPESVEIPSVFQRMIDKQRTLSGWIALSTLTVLVIPIVEEFSFRGRMQRRLERRYGPASAVAVTAAVFMTLHIGVPHWSILSLSLLLGVATGAAAWLFASISVPVLIHSLWNGSMAVLGRVNADPTSTFGEMGDGALVACAIGFTVLGMAGWLPILRAGRVGLRRSLDRGDGLHADRSIAPAA